MWLSLILLLGLSAYAENTENCKIIGLDWNSSITQEPAIQDVDSSKVLQRLQYTGDLEIDTNNNLNFINLKIESQEDKNYLIIETTDTLNDDVDKQTDPIDAGGLTFVKNQIKLICADTSSPSSFDFYLPIVDTNNHPPVFEKPSYEYSLPQPISPEYDITESTPIIATDIDFSNKNVDFTVDNPNFKISSVQTGKKKYEVRLEALKPTWFEGDLTITAHDDGDVHQTPQKVSIKINSDLSIPEKPKFESPYYEFKYSEVDGNPQLDNNGDKIKITSNLVPEVSIDNPGLFSVTYDESTKEVTIKVNSKIENPTQNPLLQTLKATVAIGNNKEETGVAILIHLPESTITPPKFESSHYEYDYDLVNGNPEIKIRGNPIKIISSLVPEVSIDNPGLFSVTYDESTKEVTIKVNSKIENPTQNPLLQTLKATVAIGNNKEATGVAILIHLPESTITPPKFESSHYEYDYDLVNGNPEIKIRGNPIKIISSLVPEVTSDKPDMFTTAYDKTTKEVTIKVNSKIKNPTENPIILTLTATVTKEQETARTDVTVLIHLPEPTITPPKFESSHYEYDYDLVNGNPEMTIRGNPIKIISSLVPEVTSDKPDMFTTAYDKTTKEVTIKVKSKIENPTENPIILTLTAKVTKEKETARTDVTVLIHLPEPTITPPRFESSYYEYDYDLVNGNPEIKIRGNPIKIISSLEPEVTSDKPDMFTTAYDKTTKEVTIKVKSKIENPTENPIILTLTAKVTKKKETARTDVTVLIHLPEPTITPPRFESSHYEYDYDLVNGNPEIKIRGNPIKIISSLEPEVTSDKPDMFTTAYDKTTKEVTIKVKSKIENPTENPIILTLTAKVTKEKETARTDVTVLIHLPEPTITPPRFESFHYEYDYDLVNGNPEIKIRGNPIKIISSLEPEVTSDKPDMFTTAYDKTTKEVTIKVKSKIENPTENPIILTLTAKVTKEKETARTDVTVLIHLPEPTITPPRFESSHYEYDYDLVNGNPEIKIRGNPIKIISSLEPEVTSDKPDMFTTAYDKTTKEVTIKVKSKIENPTENPIILTLTAKVTKEKETARTDVTVLIHLPEPTITPPRFESSHYEYDYDLVNGNPEIKIRGNPIKIISSLEPEVTSDKPDMFTTAYDKTTKEVTIKVKSKIENPTENPIILTLTAKVIKEKETARTDVTVLIHLPEQSSSSPKFDSTYYEAIYSDSSEKHTVKMNKNIKIEPSDNIEVTTSDEYFDIADDNGYYTLVVKNNLPSGILERQAFYTVTVEAKIKDQDSDEIEKSKNYFSQDEPSFSFMIKNIELQKAKKGSVTVLEDNSASTCVIIKLPNRNNNSDDSSDIDLTPYIVSIALIGTLFILFILAAIIFYFYKLRRTSSYSDMNENIIEAPETHFQRNPKLSDATKTEHPVRRPTGFIKFDLETTDEPIETATENEEPVRERRKSVVFDDTVEELQIETKGNNEENDDESDIESDTDSINHDKVNDSDKGDNVSDTASTQ